MTLDEQQAICDALGPGTWHLGRDIGYGEDSIWSLEIFETRENGEHNGAVGSFIRHKRLTGSMFAVAARTEWPKSIKERRALLAEIADLQATVEIHQEADARAIRQWQAAHPGNDARWPDHADLCVWLMEENERLKVAGKVLAQFARDAFRHSTSKEDEEACRVFEEGK